MLFSVNDTLGYRVHAVDGEIGTVHDLFFEDTTSRVRYLVADAGGWLVGRRVLLAPSAFGNLDPALGRPTGGRLWPGPVLGRLSRSRTDSEGGGDSGRA
jgi:PRC-barrel domain